MRSQAEAMAAYSRRMGQAMREDTKGPDVPMSEKGLLLSVTALAKRFGWLVYHTHDSRRSEAGFPDLCMVRVREYREAELLFVELKSRNGVVTPEQQRWMYALWEVERPNTTVKAHIWRPRHWHDGTIERVLR